MIGSLSTSTPSQSKITSSKPRAIIWTAYLLVAAGRRRPHLSVLRQLFCHPEECLPAIHFGPDLGGGDPEFAPQHDQIVQEVDALGDYRRALPANRFDHDFGRFFGQLLRHSREARSEQPRRARAGFPAAS